jgi:hypothetical protein
MGRIAQSVLALALVLVFLAQTAFFARGIWDNRERTNLRDIIYGPICIGSDQSPLDHWLLPIGIRGPNRLISDLAFFA